MNILRRRMLHPLRSRHNPIGRAARYITLLAIASCVIIALLEAGSIRESAMADKAMMAELVQFVEGRGELVERTGQYEVRYSVNKTTYEVR